MKEKVVLAALRNGWIVDLWVKSGKPSENYRGQPIRRPQLIMN